jgi:hypothetical protein
VEHQKYNYIFVNKYVISNGEKAFYCKYKKHLLSAFGRCIEHSGMPVVIGKMLTYFLQELWTLISNRWLLLMKELISNTKVIVN